MYLYLHALIISSKSLIFPMDASFTLYRHEKIGINNKSSLNSEV